MKPLEDWPLEDYPLVNCHILPWKDPPFLMGKSTISMASYSIAMLVHQRVTVFVILKSYAAMNWY